MTTLPTLTRTIDDAFMTTWYEVKKEITDNVLLATPIWAALKERGCLTPQTGGEFLTEGIGYGTETPVAVAKGDILPMGEPALDTQARWTWRYYAGKVQRSLIDDQKNSGKYRIKDYVGRRTEATRQGLVQKYESVMFNTPVTDESGKEFQGLDDAIPLFAAKSTGTWGAIARPATYAAEAGTGVYKPATGNTWWGSYYLPMSLPMEVNLLENMKTLYNSVGNNAEYPNLIITSQLMFELYENFALDASQIVKDSGSQLADLGFSVLRFKGVPMVWSQSVLTNASSKQQMLFLNTNYMEIKYDPQYWFDMTEFKTIPLQFERIAHIICTANMKLWQPRRFGRLYEA